MRWTAFTVGPQVISQYVSRFVSHLQMIKLDIKERFELGQIEWTRLRVYNVTVVVRTKFSHKRFRLSCPGGSDEARLRPLMFWRVWARERACWGSSRPREGLAHTPPSHCFCQFVSKAWRRAPWCSARCSPSWYLLELTAEVCHQ